MSVWEWIRLAAGGGLLICGLLIFLIEMYGVFHFKYVLNRMHAAALGDTLGIGCSMAGLMLLSGFRFATPKMAMVIAFLWIASPVASHLLARLEAATNEKLGEHCQVYEGLEKLEAELAEQKSAEEQKGVKVQGGEEEEVSGEERKA